MSRRVVSAIIVSMLALPGLSACQQAASAADPQADVAAIQAVEDGMQQAYKAKDPARLAALYAKDATLYIASERPRVGTEAITKGAQKDFADPAFNVTITRAKTHVSGDIGYTQGSFTVRYTNPATKAAAGYSGFYLTVFRKQGDGSWKASEDMAIPAS